MSDSFDLTGKDAGVLSVYLTGLIRAGRLPEANRILNKANPSQLRATLVEALVNSIEVTDYAQAKLAQFQKQCLTVLETPEMQHQAALLDK